VFNLAPGRDPKQINRNDGRRRTRTRPEKKKNNYTEEKVILGFVVYSSGGLFRQTTLTGFQPIENENEKTTPAAQNIQ